MQYKCLAKYLHDSYIHNSQLKSHQLTFVNRHPSLYWNILDMSGFTALNGTSPKVATKPVASAPNSDTPNGNTDEQANAPAPSPAPAVEAAPIAAPPPAPAPATAPAEAPFPNAVQPPAEQPAPVQAPAVDAAAAAVQAPTVVSPNQRESWPTQGPDRAPSAPASGDAESPNKRKRSDSHEGRTQLPTQPAKRTHKSSERTQELTPETGTVVSHQQTNGKYHQAEAQQGEAPTAASQQQAPPPSVPIQAPAEQQLVQRQSAGQVEYAPSTPQNNNQAVVQYQTPSYTEPHSGAVVQHDPKKRKRNFSNRTKTGCLTCRRRKKKCDEAKPECMLDQVTPWISDA